MRRKPEPILDYSSLAEEQRRERTAEEERREAIERYNESTLGERRPIARVFVRAVIFVGIAVVVANVLPRWPARLVISLVAVAFALWEWRKRGWEPPSWDVLWRTWRR